MFSVRRSSSPAVHTTSGVALVAMLWLVSALTIALMGVMASVRSEIRVVTLARDSAQASAVGDAAVQLVVQRMAATQPLPGGIVRHEVTFDSVNVTVTATPLSGFIHLNRAPPPLIAAALKVAGGLPPAEAEALTQQIVAQRTVRNARGQPQDFEVVEDLARLGGLSPAVLDRLAQVFTVEGPRSGLVDPLAAPPPVLQVLADGNMSAALAVERARESGQPGVDTSRLNPQYISSAPFFRFQYEARVPLEDGRMFVALRRVQLRADPRDGLPWRVFHASNRIDRSAEASN